MKNKLICITGPDGTGKSTQVNLLIEFFKERGINYQYRWLRFNHFFSLPLLGFARILGLSEVKITKNNEKIGYHYFYKSKSISGLYLILMYLDTFFSIISKVYIPMYIFKSNIICDRCIYDTVIDLMISTGDNNIYNSKIGKLYVSLLPKNSNVLMLMADENILKERREDILFDETITQKIKLYKELASKFGIHMINSNSSVSEINFQILELLNE